MRQCICRAMNDVAEAQAAPGSGSAPATTEISSRAGSAGEGCSPRRWVVFAIGMAAIETIDPSDRCSGDNASRAGMHARCDTDGLLAECRLPGSAAPAPDARQHGGRIMNEENRIAIVEDNAPQRLILTRLLEAGHAVQAFASGDEFLAAQPDVDCVLLDIEMPGSTDTRSVAVCAPGLPGRRARAFVSAHDTAPSASPPTRPVATTSSPSRSVPRNCCTRSPR